MPSFVANSPVTWPKPRLPSTMAIVSLSNTIVGAVLGRSQPLRTHSRYLRHAQHAVRIVADEIRIDEPPRDRARLVGAGSRRLRMIGGDEVDEPVRGERFIASVNLRIRRRRGAFEEIEVAALVGLRDVLLVERAEAALVPRRRRLSTRRGGARARLGATFSSSRRAARRARSGRRPRTSASGPPTNDSGATCSTHAP